MRLAFVAAISMFVMNCHAESGCDFPEHMCASQKAFERADARMMETLEAIQVKIESNGFEDFMVDSAAISESLARGQLAWQGYMEGHCAAVFRLMSGGTSRQIDELDCMAELTDARVQQLRALYEVEPGVPE